jgi:hypothetical protein
MRNGTKLVLCAVIVLAVAVSGCGPKRQWGTCAIAGGLVGGTLGAVGGGVGVDQVQPNPNNWKRAAGAGGGWPPCSGESAASPAPSSADC